MESNEVLEKINEIFIDVLDDEDISVNPETTANDVEDWDSLSHIQLVVAIEKSFGIQFNASEIQGWKNVGEIIASIVEKKG